MSSRILHLTSDVEVRLMPTTTGVAISIFGEHETDSHAGYPWDEMGNNLIGEHAIPVLRKDDYRITPESQQFLINIGKSMKARGQEILDRTEKLTVVVPD